MKYFNLIMVLFSFTLISHALADDSNPTKLDIMSKGEKVGFRVQKDCALAEKYLYKSCTYIPEQLIYCSTVGEKVIKEVTDCSGEKIHISFGQKSNHEIIRAKQGQGNFQRKVKLTDMFRMQQQQQQQESRR